MEVTHLFDCSWISKNFHDRYMVGTDEVEHMVLLFEQTNRIVIILL
jgi:hypothetical protein